MDYFWKNFDVMHSGLIWCNSCSSARRTLGKGIGAASEWARPSARILFSFTRKGLYAMTFRGDNDRDIAVGLAIIWPRPIEICAPQWKGLDFWSPGCWTIAIQTSLQVANPKKLGPYVFQETVGEDAFSIVKFVLSRDRRGARERS
jgi:hypothetical protein